MLCLNVCLMIALKHCTAIQGFLGSNPLFYFSQILYSRKVLKKDVLLAHHFSQALFTYWAHLSYLVTCYYGLVCKGLYIT